MADKKKMSVAEMLAAARKADGGGAAEDAPAPGPEDAAAGDDTAAETSSAAETVAEAAPAGPPQKVAKPGSKDRPGVSDILAMARAGKASGGAEQAKPKAKPKAKADAKAPAAAAKTQAGAKSKSAKPQAAERDTASILAAARKATKPGPMSKADAAAKKKADPKGPAKKAIVVPPMPAKPDYAKGAGAGGGAKPQAAKSADVERRGFLSLGFWSLGIVTALWTLLSVKFFFPNVRREPPSKFKVGSPDGFAPGQVETKFKAQFGVWIVNTEYNGEQQLFALKSVCTHLGCTPNWLEAEQKFKCPCHGSGFYKDGINFEGPAPRPLERYAIQLASDGQVEIDKSKTFQEEMGHWDDPTSFVSV